jgi:two-component system chemotaxis response regulator CheY
MKVLVVDDDVVSRMMLMHLVDSCGQHGIVEAEDGADAWTQLAAGLRPAIVFCDLRMPNLSGMDLLQRVRADAALAATPFVLVSAASDTATLAQAGRCGADGYIVKPFGLEQVRAQLARVPEAPPSEAPAAAARRLGITLGRLLDYLAGLRRQLEDAALLPEALPAQERAASLLRLSQGCATLGLAQAAAQLAGAGEGAGIAAAQAALAQALVAVGEQEARARKAAAESAC